MKNLQYKLLTFLLGFSVGSLLALSIRYPLDIDTIDKYQSYCHESKIKSVKVGLSGDIYFIKCENGYQTDPPH